MTSRQCIECIHYLVATGFCKALQDNDGIPAESMTGEHDHKKPFPGDRRIRYEPTEAIAKIDALRALFVEAEPDLSRGTDLLSKALEAERAALASMQQALEVR